MTEQRLPLRGEYESFVELSVGEYDTYHVWVTDAMGARLKGTYSQGELMQLVHAMLEQGILRISVSRLDEQ